MLKKIGFVGGDQDKEMLIDGKYIFKYLDSVRYFLGSKNDFYSFGYKQSKIIGKKCLNYTASSESANFFERIGKKLGFINSTMDRFENCDIIFATNSIYNLDLLESVKKKKEKKIIEVSHAMGYVKPYIESRKKYFKNGIVNVVICYDLVSKKTFEDLYTDAQVIAVKNPYYEYYKIKKTLFKNFYLNRGEKKYTKIALVTLQWGYAGEDVVLNGILNNGLMPECLEDVIKELQNVFFIIRMHPVQLAGLKTNYNWVKDYVDNMIAKYCNVCDFERSNCNLFSILEHADIHLTMSSMASYECSYFGIPTIFLCPTLLNDGVYKDYFEDLEGKDFAIKTHCEKKIIIDLIYSIKKKSILDDNMPALSLDMICKQ